MNKIKIEIWGRVFEVYVYYKKFKDTEIIEAQKIACESLLNTPNAIEDAKEIVISYIQKNYSKELLNQKIDNIFKYVIPQTIFIPKNTGKRIVALLCDFRFDIEHGIAIIFENEKVTKIVSQDDIL